MEVMVLSQKVSSGLMLTETAGLDEVKRVCKFIYQTVVQGASSTSPDAFKDDILGSISTVLFESARMQSSAQELKEVLKEQGVSDEISTFISALYDQNRDIFIQRISNTVISHPSLVNISWRLNYDVRSKHGGRENVPSFLVTLELKDRGFIRYVDMAMTSEQLQDMNSKMRDAIKQVDRLINAP